MSVITIKKRHDEALIPEYMRASALFPPLSYDPDEHCFLLNDQSMGFGFVCQPLSGTSEQLQDRVNSFLNQDYPANTLLQFMLFRSPDVQRQLASMVELRSSFKNDLLGAVVKERVDFLRQASREKLITTTNKGTFESGLFNDSKLVVTCKVPLASAQPTEQECVRLAALKTRVGSALHTIGLAPAPLTAKSYIRLMQTLLNWGENASWRNQADSWETDRPICNQLLDPDSVLEVGDGVLEVGGYYAKVLSARKLPDQLFFGDAMGYITDLTGGELRIKENYLVTVTLSFPNPEEMKPSLERKRQFAVNQAYGPMLKFVPVLADKKHGLDVIHESINDGFRPIKLSYSLVLFAPSKEQAEAAATAAITFWKERKFHMMEDRLVSLQMFINSLPLCSEHTSVKFLWRYKTMTTQEAAVLLPIFGEWKGTGTFHVALTSRNGQLMSLSLHDSDTNKNLVIAAETGSGKSFLANELIHAYLSEGAQVWVIDAGKSYKQLCEIVGGDFVHFGEGSQICLNPFELVVDYDDDEDALVGLVSAMASIKGLLNEWQGAALRKVMHQLWQEMGTSLTVDDIAARCLENQDQRLKDVGTQLHVFTDSGSYGDYFAGKNNMNFKNQFTVLELDELQGRKHLRQVILLQLIYQIQQEVFLGERGRKKIVIIDEAWDLLKDGEVASFIEHAYRKFRKYGGSVIIATQSINDLYENSVGRAIAENSANMYLLGQTAEAIESVKGSKRLALSEGGFALLKSVHTLPGVYSEIFVKSRHGIGIGRLVVGDFQKLLYSTDPIDTHAINSLIKQGQSLPEAIYTIIEQRKRVRRIAS